MTNKIFLLVLLISAFTLNAQHVHTEFGLKGGLNITTLNHAQLTPNDDPRMSFHLGLLAHVHLAKHIAVQPELLFSGQGSKQTISNIVYHTDLSYLNLPLLLQFMVGTGVRLQAGPQVGLLMSAKSKANSIVTDIMPGFLKYDFSWAFGMGYINRRGLGVDLRFNLGVVDIANSSSVVSKNRAIQLGIFKQFEKREKKS